jgi:hypothetical protein
MTPFSLLVDRTELLCPMLGADEREHAERLLQLCRELASRPRHDGKLPPEPRDIDAKRELGRLTELLGRRASKALPAATLGRAALAELSNDARSFQAACAQCDANLILLGY